VGIDGQHFHLHWPTGPDPYLAARLDAIDEKLEKLMSQQDEINAAAQAIEADVARIAAAVAAVQAEIAALQQANPGLDLTALNQAVADLGNATTSVEALEPPAAPAAAEPAADAQPA
jgi:chromosome segregation ATPase